MKLLIGIPQIGDTIVVTFRDGRSFNGATRHPGIVARVWENGVVNCRVFTDSSDCPLWLTSLHHVEDIENILETDNYWDWAQDYEF